MTSIIRDLLKVAKGLIAYRFGDEGWLLPDRTYLEVKMFQGHTQLVIDWYMWKHLRFKGKTANEKFSLISLDIKEWKKAGLPVSDFHYFSPQGYDPTGYAFDLGWTRINEDGFEIPRVDAFGSLQDFLMSKLGSTLGNKAKVYVNVYGGKSYLTNIESIMEASSIGDLMMF